MEHWNLVEIAKHLTAIHDAQCMISRCNEDIAHSRMVLEKLGIAEVDAAITVVGLDPDMPATLDGCAVVVKCSGEPAHFGGGRTREEAVLRLLFGRFWANPTSTAQTLTRRCLQCDHLVTPRDPVMDTWHAMKHQAEQAK